MAKFFKVVLGIFLALVIIVLIGGFIFIKTFDLNKYKPYVTDLASKELGRKVEIAGDSSLGISLSPTIILRDVSIANADWAKEPYMAKVGELEVKLALLPLLHKQIEIDNILLSDANVNLAVSASGEQNWVFKLPSGEETAQNVKNVAAEAGIDVKEDKIQEIEKKAAKVEEVNSGAAALAGFAAKNVEIENSVVTYSDLKSKQNMSLKINSLKMAAESMDSNITAKFDLLFNQQAIKGETTVGSINSLLNNKPNFPVILDASAYGIQLGANGTANNLMQDPSFNADVNVYNPAGNFGAPETTLKAKVSGNMKKIAADISVLNIVNNLVTGNVKADISGKVPFIYVDLKSNKIDLTNFEKSNNLAFVLPELIASANASDLVPNDAIPFNLLNTANADVKLSIANLIIASGMQASNVYVDAKLQNGILNVAPVKLNFGGGQIDASLQANAANDSVVLKLVSQGMKLQNLHKEFVVQNDKDFGVISGGNIDFDINLSGSGATYRQLVNNLNGRVIAIAGESVLQTGKLDFFMGNFVSQLLTALNISQNKSRNIDMTCAVVRSDLGGGKANFPKGIAFNSKQMNLVSDGNINLVNDKIDFAIRPFSGKIVDTNIAQALSSFIKVKGTLSNPKITIDDAQALKAIVGVAATGGTAYLGSKLVLDADSSPCYTALQGTPYQSRFPAPSKVESAGQDLYQGTEKAIDNSVKDIKGAAKDIINIFKGKK